MSDFEIQYFALANADVPFYPVSDISTDLLENAHSVIRHESTTFEVKRLDKAVIHYEMVVTLLKGKSPYKDVLIGYDKSFDKIELEDVRIYDKWGDLVRKIKTRMKLKYYKW